MLLILLDVVGDGASDLHAGEQVEVAQDEEGFAVLLEVFAHDLLVAEEVLLVVFGAEGVGLGAIHVLHVVVALVLPVAEGENVVLELHNQQGEVNLRQLVIQHSQFVVLVGCPWLCGPARPARIKTSILRQRCFIYFCQRGLLSDLIFIQRTHKNLNKDFNS